MARVLIAGCGYVGAALGERLAAQGHEVFGLRRRPKGLPATIQGVAADLASPASLAALPPHLDTVFYAASAGARTPAAYEAAYVTGVANLLGALEAAGQPVGRFFFVSSTGVYGQTGGVWVDEDSPAASTRFTSRALLEGERRALTGPFPATVARFSGIYGPARTRLIDSVRAGDARRYGDRKTYLNHIHRDDAAGVLAHLMGMAAPKDLYLATDDEPVERSAALEWIAAQLGVPPPSFSRPDAEENVRGTERRYRNRRLRETGFRFQFPTYREGYGALLADPRAKKP